MLYPLPPTFVTSVLGGIIGIGVFAASHLGRTHLGALRQRPPRPRRSVVAIHAGSAPDPLPRPS